MTIKMIRQLSNKEITEWLAKDGLDSDLKTMLQNESNRRYQKWAKKAKK